MPQPGVYWDYTVFGRPPSTKPPEQTLERVFEKTPNGARPYNLIHRQRQALSA